MKLPCTKINDNAVHLVTMSSYDRDCCRQDDEMRPPLVAIRVTVLARQFGKFEENDTEMYATTLIASKPQEAIIIYRRRKLVPAAVNGLHNRFCSRCTDG